MSQPWPISRGQEQRPRLALIGLALAVLASGALLIHLDSHLTFFSDGWELLVNRRGMEPSVFLRPFAEHPVIGPVALRKLCMAIFGMSSATPYYAVSIGLFLASAVLLFAYLRRRVGDALALLGTVVVLFLGAAFEDLLWASQMNFFGSVAAGLGMLLVLDRDERRSDWIATALLTVSIAFSGVGLAFAAGAVAELALARSRPRRWARIVLVPLALFALWWVGWGHAESHLSLYNALHLPAYVLDSAAAGVTSLLGRPSYPAPFWAKPALIAAAVALAVLLYRERRVSRGLLVAIAVGLAFWALTGLDRSPLRPPTASRYQYMSAVFLLLIAGEALRGRRLPRAALGVGALITVVAVAGGISLLHREYRDRWLPGADLVRSRLAAVDIAGEAARPSFAISFPPFVTISDRSYLSTVDAYGTPAFSEEQLERADPGDRAAADRTLVRALGLKLVPGHAPGGSGRCATTAGDAPGKALPPSETATLSNGSRRPVAVSLSRFGDGAGVVVGRVAPGGAAALSVPRDGSRAPWRIRVRGGSLRVCAGGPDQTAAAAGASSS